MTERLPAGSIVGILGGGQLGRMLAMAAARLGYRCHIYEPAADCPASHVAWRTTTAPYVDGAALAAFAESVSVVTYEFENVPVAALDLIEARVPIRPNRRALAVSQDRMGEKEFLAGLGFAVAPYAAVDTAGDLAAALATIGAPAILKTRRLGYDGKGQARIGSPADCGAAFAAMQGAPAILEGFVTFEREVSVVAARGLSGEVAAFDPGENVHEGGILRMTTVPAAPRARAAYSRGPSGRQDPERARLCRRHRGGALRNPHGPCRQRDRPARPQYRPLDRSGLRRRPV
jgi:5-(carboxyamino)imidazole ribonucleotide synthase